MNSEPIKICYVIDNLSRAGTEMQLLLLLQHLDQRLITPYLCLLDGESDPSRELEPDNVTIIRLGIKRLVSTRAMRGARRFRKFLKQHQIQIVQSFFPDSTRFASPIARFSGVSTILGSRRNIGHWMTAWDRRIAKFYNRTCINQVIANCEAARQSVIQQEKMPGNRVLIIPNGIDLRRFEPFQPWTPADGQTNWTIGMVGNLREVKGPDLFIDAAKLLLGKHKNLQFIIAGEGDRELYQQRITEHGIQEHFCLNGAENQIPQFLSKLDVAVLPSRAEGMPNAILEYMAAGRPIVATRVGGTAELLAHRNTGILVPPESASELAAGIQSLLDEPSLAASLAQAARVQVAELYDIHRISERHYHFYREGTVGNE